MRLSTWSSTCSSRQRRCDRRRYSGQTLFNGDDRPPTTERSIGDVILAAQVATLASADGIVATTNVGHLSRYVHAALWRDIGPDS